MKYFVANWKANKNYQEAETWFDEFLKLYKDESEVTVVVCPPLPFIKNLKQKTDQYQLLKLGVQNISQFEEGPYTGEVTAKSLHGLADYAIVGHSERRKYFKEDESILFQKVLIAHKNQLQPIYCIRGTEDKIPPAVKIVAYEPVGAIGTGNNAPPEKVIEIKNKLHLQPNTAYLYGGSVNEKNVSDYLINEKIDGLLIGGASLDPISFYKMIS